MKKKIDETRGPLPQVPDIVLEMKEDHKEQLTVKKGESIYLNVLVTDSRVSWRKSKSYFVHPVQKRGRLWWT